jgi:polyribonucleotide nucleotidyltransferase
MISGIPFDGPIGAVRVAYTPTASGSRTPPTKRATPSTFELVVAGRELDNGDVADHDGRGRRHREELRVLRRRRPEGRRGRARPRPRGLQDLDQGVDRPAAPARRGDRPQGPDRADGVRRPGRLHARGVRRRRRRRQRQARRDHQDRRQGRAQRRHRCRKAADAIAQLRRGRRLRRARSEVKAAVRSLTKKLVRKRIVDEGIRIDGRGPRDLRPLSAEVGSCCRRRTAPACSSVARPRSSTSSPWPCRAWTRCSTRSTR